jgi:hypothetical protein
MEGRGEDVHRLNTVVNGDGTAAAAAFCIFVDSVESLTSVHSGTCAPSGRLVRKPERRANQNLSIERNQQGEPARIRTQRDRNPNRSQGDCMLRGSKANLKGSYGN